MKFPLCIFFQAVSEFRTGVETNISTPKTLWTTAPCMHISESPSPRWLNCPPTCPKAHSTHQRHHHPITIELLAWPPKSVSRKHEAPTPTRSHISKYSKTLALSDRSTVQQATQIGPVFVRKARSLLSHGRQAWWTRLWLPTLMVCQRALR